MPSIRMILFLLVSPPTMSTLEGLIPSRLARNLMQALLAAPSTGGDVRRIFNAPFISPDISFLDALG